MRIENGSEPRNPRALDAASKVIPFPKAPGGNFSNFTAAILLQKFRSGTLDEAVFLALMANAGLRP